MNYTSQVVLEPTSTFHLNNVESPPIIAIVGRKLFVMDPGGYRTERWFDRNSIGWADDHVALVWADPTSDSPLKEPGNQFIPWILV